MPNSPRHHFRPWWRILSAALLLACASVGIGRPAAAQSADSGNSLELRFLDVGQADAILIRLGHKAVLVDAGRGDDIVLVLGEEGIDSLVAAIASHNHEDHIGGMDAVLYSYPVAEYLANGRTPEGYNARNVEATLGEKHIRTPKPPWSPIMLGDTRITVFPSLLDPKLASENNSSLGVLVERGKFKALLTGDSEQDELSAWLKAGRIPRVTILKAAHHGAGNGLTPGWIDATRPDVVIISVGANNTYGHPDQWALRYYGLHNRQIYRTDRDGTVVVSVDSAGGYEVRALGPVER